MTHLRFAILSFAFLGLAFLGLAAPGVALAGACPTCTASSECTNPEGGAAFCVVHEATVGCGDLVTLCCPGQGCAISGGRPSCEAAGTCTVIEDLADAGMPDAGMADTGTGTDTGAGTDTGTGTDTGMGSDAGPGMDAGGTPSTSGCGCRTSSASPTIPAILGLAGLVVTLAARRRR